MGMNVVQNLRSSGIWVTQDNYPGYVSVDTLPVHNTTLQYYLRLCNDRIALILPFTASTRDMFIVFPFFIPNFLGMTVGIEPATSLLFKKISRPADDAIVGK